MSWTGNDEDIEKLKELYSKPENCTMSKAWREEMIKKWDETAKAADLELKEPHNKKVFPVIL